MRALSIQNGYEIVKNEHVRYTLERFPTDNARVIYTKRIWNRKKWTCTVYVRKISDR